MTSFNEACELAKAELEAGNILDLYVEKSDRLGIVIYTETDQGWNPRPFWCQYEENIEMDIEFNL